MPATESNVTLREITADTVDAVIKLSVADSQKRFVAPNSVSLAQSIFAPEAWYRAIYSGEEPAGFVMLYDESLRSTPPAAPKVAVWRFMVAAQYQGQGVGSAAMRLVIAHVRSKGCFRALELSYVPAEGSPEPFYLSHGFRNTDRIEDGERVMELSLGSA
jgi:diamine N-acetyltransferase